MKSINLPRSVRCPPGDRGRFLAPIQAAIDAARRLNCPHIIVFSGRVAKGVSREKQHQSIVDGLNSAADLAEKHDVKLLLENIDLEEARNIICGPLKKGSGLSKK